MDACASRLEGFFYKIKDGASIFGNGFGPGEAAHLREIDAAKAESRDKNIYAISEWFVSD